jgi:predicted HTH domain antitoxin
MFTLYSDDEIMQMCFARRDKEAERRVAARLIRGGKLSLDEIADSVPSLSMDELKQMQEELTTAVHA